MGGVALLSHPFATVRPVNHGLPTRNEQAPDNHVVVIRAGVLTGKSVEEAATRCLQGYGIVGISVEAAVARIISVDIERGITL